MRDVEDVFRHPNIDPIRAAIDGFMAGVTVTLVVMLVMSRTRVDPIFTGIVFLGLVLVADVVLVWFDPRYEFGK